MCARAKADGVDAIMINHPEVLGDTYAEVRSLYQTWRIMRDIEDLVALRP